MCLPEGDVLGGGKMGCQPHLSETANDQEALVTLSIAMSITRLRMRMVRLIAKAPWRRSLPRWKRMRYRRSRLAKFDGAAARRLGAMGEQAPPSLF